MDGYISKETALKFQLPVGLRPKKVTVAQAVADAIAEYINAIPAADVVEVRHGRWIPDQEDVEWGNSLIRYRCSECRERPHFDKEKHRFILSPYCPHCGTKMDLPYKIYEANGWWYE